MWMMTAVDDCEFYGFVHIRLWLSRQRFWVGSLSVHCILFVFRAYTTHVVHIVHCYTCPVLHPVYPSIPLSARLLGNVLVVSSLEHLDRHADLNPALQVLGCARLGEKGRDLHPQTALELRAFVHVSVLPKGPVWLYWVAETGVLVDVGQFAAGGGVSGCLPPRRYTRRIRTEQSDTRRGIPRRRACYPALAGAGSSSMSLHRRAFHHRPLSTDVSQPLWSKVEGWTRGHRVKWDSRVPSPPSVDGTHRRCWRGTACTS